MFLLVNPPTCVLIEWCDIRQAIPRPTSRYRQWLGRLICTAVREAPGPKKTPDHKLIKAFECSLSKSDPSSFSDIVMFTSSMSMGLL